MSDAESDVSPPSDDRVEDGLRVVVGQIFKSGNHENLTLKRVRKAAEDELNLPANFFRSNDDWKERSKDFITAEVVCFL